MSKDLEPDKEKPEEQEPESNESWERFLQFTTAILGVSKEEIEEEKRREEEDENGSKGEETRE